MVVVGGHISWKIERDTNKDYQKVVRVGDQRASPSFEIGVHSKKNFHCLLSARLFKQELFASSNYKLKLKLALTYILSGATDTDKEEELVLAILAENSFLIQFLDIEFQFVLSGPNTQIYYLQISLEPK